MPTRRPQSDYDRANSEAETRAKKCAHFTWAAPPPTPTYLPQICLSPQQRNARMQHSANDTSLASRSAARTICRAQYKTSLPFASPLRTTLPAGIYLFSLSVRLGFFMQSEVYSNFPAYSSPQSTCSSPDAYFVLNEAEACTQLGEAGAFPRREGL